jgi:hypothetical protein
MVSSNGAEKKFLLCSFLFLMERPGEIWITIATKENEKRRKVDNLR